LSPATTTSTPADADFVNKGFNRLGSVGDTASVQLKGGDSDDVTDEVEEDSQENLDQE